jgi:hypothetical protein
MTPLYTEEEFKKAKSRDLLRLSCETCNKDFFKVKSQIQATIASNKKDTKKKHSNANKYCSKKCQFLGMTTEIKSSCGFCGIPISKDKREANKSKTGFNFCSRSCSAKYTNSHKKHGTRVSKLEVWLSKKLEEIYPNFKFDFNKTDAINAELDIYIPEIKLAFELNGIYHYEPIYGEERLKKTQNNDQRKFQACLEKGISLCSIDTSKQSRFTEKSSVIYLDVVQEVIKKHLENLKDST